ncbi:carnitine dehydratase [Rhodoferax koreense]|uniref:Carnitine dehydratase n=1 Tax=Rhodoferax koreensis TaxID=1842727 RepID=A0A1P8JXC9_9BURK|nr:CoA transferase [Rhodoferax koreense]APW38406.1 carnitine dehydratase [Rhodoferax koreense]
MPEPTSPGALAGIRVIDLSRVLGGPYCGQILGDHGADVLKVEPPQGDDTRAWGPPFQDGVASYYLGLNRNKLGTQLDLTTASGREVLLGLLEGADVLVENFKTGTMEKWGLGHEVLAERFPRLVHCRVSGFGADGPLGGLAGYDAAVQALSGIMSVNGEAGGQPLRVGLPVVDLVTGLNAALGVLMALQERGRSGRGQFVEASLFDCALSLLHPHAANWFLDGRSPGLTGNAHPNIYPYDAFPTAGVPVFLAVGNDRQFRLLCQHLATSWAQDARYATAGARSVNRAALREAIEPVLSTQDGAALAEALMAIGVPCAPILTVDAALQHPHTAHREMVVRIGNYTGVGSPIKLSRTPASYRHAPPTRLGKPPDESTAG